MANKSRRRQIRKEEATLRNAERLKRSDSEQLTFLDERLGKNLGAARERDRLNKKIEDVHNKSKSKKIRKNKKSEGMK